MDEEVLNYIKSRVKKGYKEDGNKLKIFGYSIDAKKIYTVKYSDIYRYDEDNSYKKIDNASNEVGVYIFHELNDDKKIKKILYVGESSTDGNWSLKKRMQQHFRKKDSGGVLFTRITNKNNCCEKCAEKYLLSKAYLSYIILEKNKDLESIKYLESLLIGLLRPEYNFGGSKKKINT